MTDNQLLKKRLEDLYRTFGNDYINSDPLKFSHRYKGVRNIETVGLISAVLAYGNVRQIFNSVEKVLAVLGDSPYDFVLNFNPERDVRKFGNIKHRFNSGFDIAFLIYLLKQIYERFLTLEDCFLEGYNSDDANIGKGLINFVDLFFSLNSAPFYSKGIPGKAGIRFLLSSPLKKSACKRMNLFLRWMVRTEGGYDHGIWKRIPASKLLIPLDTHSARICRYLGLSERKNSSWSMALEVTERLREMDPLDPVKYDFALSRLGILDLCEHRYVKDLCEMCSLFQVCRIAGTDKRRM